MFTFIQNWFKRRVIAGSTITRKQWDETFASLPLLRGLPPDEQRELREMVIRFLHEKTFSGAHGLTVTPAMSLFIALQACLPILAIGLDAYAGWSSVIIYPSGFAPERVYTDEYGVEHRVQEQLSGEAWLKGPVLLSWDDTEHSTGLDGYNLVIHEFVHKLDMQNGTANGYPPLHTDMDHEQWVAAFTAGFADFRKRTDRGEYFGIDDYAATSPAEFFAVLSEVFFERPDILNGAYPDIYGQLRQFYRQDTLPRLHLSAAF